MLKAGAERKTKARAFTAARELDAKRRHHRRVKRHPDPVRPLEILKVEILEPRGHFAGIDEERHVHEWPGGPAVLSGEEHAIAVAEGPRGIRSQRVSSA